MLLLLPLLAALATTPDTTPVAPATRLEEIGRVRALPACTPIVIRANSAIGDALGNDSTLAILVMKLRNMDYDNMTELSQRHSRAELAEFTKKLHDGAVAGEGDVKKLRELAEASPNPERKAELKAFADALGGALFRQKRVAFDLDRAVTIHDARTQAFSTRIQDNGFHSITHDLSTQLPNNGGAWAGNADLKFNPTLRDIADDFTGRIQLITADEGSPPTILKPPPPAARRNVVVAGAAEAYARRNVPRVFARRRCGRIFARRPRQLDSH